MKKLLFAIIILSLLACKSKLDNWVKFQDKFKIGTILLPKQPTVTVDTMIAPNFKLIHNSNMVSLDNPDISPSTFNYEIIFPTNNNDFDLYKMKMDSNSVKTLLNRMINWAIKSSNSQLKQTEIFNYPEPGVKIMLHNDIKKLTSVTRIIIFDNFIIIITAAGKDSNYNNDTEEAFFNSLKIQMDKRLRK